eukprot:TRINITY_DN8685_c0_g1_i1.p1 TRINITY_DN8685_c0_g1~~TRINITY_DN8685_c0_g1_i1.p1  ORF type:complete len:118 (-),score=29.03 TRINITY_DN8685_c0_g1_i1:348-701(-)
MDLLDELFLSVSYHSMRWRFRSFFESAPVVMAQHAWNDLSDTLWHASRLDFAKISTDPQLLLVELLFLWICYMLLRLTIVASITFVRQITDTVDFFFTKVFPVICIAALILLSIAPK